MSNSFINLNLFPSATATGGYRTWLNEIVKTAGIEDFDPVLKPIKTPNGYVNEDGTPYKEFDYLQTIPDFSLLSGVGDYRYSLGHMVSAALETFLPRILLYTEIAQAGGCQVIENYICDADGVPIKQLETTCPVGTTLDIINPQEVVDFVFTKYNTKKTEDIQSFYDYINDNYIKNGFIAEICQIDKFPYFVFLRLKKENETIYKKYHYDDRTQLSILFKTPIIYIAQKDATDSDILEALQEDVPLYNIRLTI